MIGLINQYHVLQFNSFREGKFYPYIPSLKITLCVNARRMEAKEVNFASKSSQNLIIIYFNVLQRDHSVPQYGHIIQDVKPLTSSLSPYLHPKLNKCEYLIFFFPNKRIYTNTHNVNLIKILFN